MAIRFYDDALVNKIKNWTKDPNLTILKPDETSRLFRIQSDINNDTPIKLPLIALSRDKSIKILNTNKQVKSFNGYKIVKNARDKAVVPLNVIPIGLTYQLDLYTKRMEEADEYIRNFVFNFVNMPKLKIAIAYNDIRLEHESNVYLASDIEDNSDIQEHLFPDQFVRFTMRLEVDDAYLFSEPVKQPYTIEDEVLPMFNEELIEYYKTK